MNPRFTVISVIHAGLRHHASFIPWNGARKIGARLEDQGFTRAYGILVDDDDHSNGGLTGSGRPESPRAWRCSSAARTSQNHPMTRERGCVKMALG